jgi:EAL domain-containing protein (putative c-di-GMP-specific phosphodiesterase class I)/ActR/RegA family two-component response regulator
MKPSLLVLDDESIIREFVEHSAVENGYVVTSAEHPGNISATELSGFDVIVLDLQMPNVDGIEVLRKLGCSGWGGKLVLMSGMDERTLDAARNVAVQHGIEVLGILPKPFHSDDLDDLLHRAHIPSTAIEFQTEPSSVTVPLMRNAIIADEFEIHYQPKVSLSNGRICGVEALARWRHPVDGLLYPSTFIHLAELPEFAIPFTFAILNKVASNIRILKKATGYIETVSVNLPISALIDVRLPERAITVITSNGLEPSQFCFEVTETSLPTDTATSLDILTRLHMRGIKLSIDDFGTGHSSLTRLQNTPFSELKIDQIFVSEVANNTASRAIVENAVRLGHSLNMQVVAEGPEDAATMDILSSMGCDIAQGYYVSRPLPLEQFTNWLLTHHTYKSVSQC